MRKEEAMRKQVVAGSGEQKNLEFAIVMNSMEEVANDYCQAPLLTPNSVHRVENPGK